MNHENEWLYGFAASLKERITILKDAFPADRNLTALKKWRRRKSLLSDSDFSNMLRTLNISMEEYNLAVSDLTERKLKMLYSHVRKQKWYQIHKSLFTKNVQRQSNDLEVALRFHTEYYVHTIQHYLSEHSLLLSNQALLAFRDNLINDLLSVSKATLTWDVHDIKDRTHLFLDDAKEEFNAYIEFRFGTAESTQLFFLEYPALSRLLAARLIFAVENFKMFVDSIESSSNTLSKVFNIQQPFTITSVQGRASDSHNQGKSTVLFSINNKKLVYKYHNNDILHFYNKLLTYLNDISPIFSLYQIKGISADNYCIEEFIEHRSCSQIEEIQEYYRKYGVLIAITHLLGSSDLHMENLIADGADPVLVDTETLLLAEERRIYTNKFSKNRFMESESVIVSGLLPMHKYWKRQLDYSALNGVRQKIPYKVRRLLNEKTSDIKYFLEDYYVEPANNNPLLNGTPVLFTDYYKTILNGYLDAMYLLLQNKNDILTFCRNYLNHCPIRILLRDTQDYANFLSFSIHPSCMVDFIEHEKVLENLWNHSFLSDKAIPHEVESLTYCDIPYFYTLTDSFHLFSNSGVINGYFNHHAFSVFTEHIKKLEKQSIRFSALLISEALDALEIELYEVPIPQKHHYDNPALRLAADIKDCVIDNIFVDTARHRIIWPEIDHSGDKNSRSIYYPEINFYNGASGVFTFLYALKYYTGETISILPTLEHEVFINDLTEDSISAFYGYGARILSAYILLQLTHEKKFSIYLDENLKKLMEKDFSVSSAEWLKGTASLICLLVRIIETDCSKSAEFLLDKLILQLTIDENINNAGFAHGYAGILYALIRANSLRENKTVETHISKLCQLFRSTVSADLNSSWCNGTLGINQALKELLNYNSDMWNQYKLKFLTPNRICSENYCICHGKYGEVNTMIELLTDEEITAENYLSVTESLIQEPIMLKSAKNIYPPGMFTGLSGIGYQLLRMYDNSLFDILFFK